MAESTLFQQCAGALGDSNDLLLCISNQYETLQKNEISVREDSDRWLSVISGSMVFFMQAGFAMVAAGAVRKKNVQNTMLKNLLDACGAALAFYFVGYAMAFGDDGNASTQNTFIGTQNFFTTGRKYNVDLGFWFFQYAFSATSVTIVAGTLAERCRMGAYLLYSIYLTGWIYPVIAHAMWSSHGFLSPFSSRPLLGKGVVDFAGGGVVHVTGGTVALVATLILGARQGRFHDAAGNLLAEPRVFPAYSIALQLMGTFILWFGWFGFNAGSSLLLGLGVESGGVAARAIANTALSGAAAGVSTFLLQSMYAAIVRGEASFHLVSVMNGVLSGLVAITSGCGTMDLWGAFVSGAIAGPIYLLGSNALVRLRIDDVVDSIPVHLFNGVWGMLACGIFSTDEALQRAFKISSGAGLFGNQVIGVLFIIGWSVAMAYPFFLILNFFGILRTDVLAEVIGLDVVNLDASKHGPAISGEVQHDIDTFRNELDKSTRGDSNHVPVAQRIAPSSNGSEIDDY